MPSTRTLAPTRRDTLRAILGSSACAAAALSSGCEMVTSITEKFGYLLIFGVDGSSADNSVFAVSSASTATTPPSTPLLNGTITASVTAPLPASQPAPQLIRRLTNVSAGPLAYLLDNANQQVAILDLGLQTVTGHIPLTNSVFSPGVIALTPDGQTLLVATHDQGQNPRLLVIALATQQIAATIPLSSGFGLPTGIAVTPDGQFAYVTANLETTPGVVWLADIVSRKFVTGVSIPTTSLSAAVSPDGSSVYVATTPTTYNKQTGADQEMTVIDTLTNTAAIQINFPNGFFGLDKVAISPNGRHVYSTSNGPNVAVVDAVTNTFSSLIKVAPAVTGVTRMALTPGGRYLYTLDQGDLNLNLIDLWTGALVSRTPTVSPPTGQTWSLLEIFLLS